MFAVVMLGMAQLFLRPISLSCDTACQAMGDLRAQQAMADAAWAMFWATSVGVAVGISSLALLLLTVRYTKQAADAAVQAVSEAREGTSAAREAVSETRRIGEVQARAYIDVKVTNVTFLATPQRVTWTVDALNSGATPARNVRMEMGVDRAAGDFNPAWTISVVGPDAGSSSQAAGQPLKMDGSTHLTEDEVRRIRALELIVWVHGRIEYQDVFGANHFTDFRWRFHPDRSNQPRFHVEPAGNDAN